MRTLKIILCVVTALSILAFGLAIYYTQFFKDTVAPEFNLDSNIVIVSVKDGDAALLEGVTARDNRDGDISDQIIVDGVSQLTGANTARVRYYVFDKAENLATASRTVLYTDYSSPRIHILQPLVYDVGNTIILRGKVVATDVLEGNITPSIRLSSDDLSNKSAGLYHLTIWVMNRMGDVSSVRVPVIVREPDPNAPIIQLKRYLAYISKGDDFDPEDYFKSFYSSPNIPISGSYERLTVSGEVDTSKPGTYEVCYAYTNSYGSSTEVYLTVVVEDVTGETEEDASAGENGLPEEIAAAASEEEENPS